jgi:hypothetical protein
MSQQQHKKIYIFLIIKILEIIIDTNNNFSQRPSGGKIDIGSFSI